jgi:hypothetical protein
MKIDNLNTVVAKPADKQSIPVGIEGEMINPTLDPEQSNRLLQRQRLSVDRCSAGATKQC